MSIKTDSWRDRASIMLVLSSSKIKLAANRAGSVISSVSDTAENAVKKTYVSTKENWNASVQPKLDVTFSNASKVASETGEKLKNGFLETKERIHPRIKSSFDSFSQSASQTSSKLKKSFYESKEKWRLGDATKTSFERTRNMFSIKTNKSETFGVPLETIVQRQTEILIPHIVLSCCEFISVYGYTNENIFDSNCDAEKVSVLMKKFEADDNLIIPEGTDPCVVGQVLKTFFLSLPEPVFTFSLYEKFLQFDGDVFYLKDLITLLPPIHRATLDCLFHLFLEISKKSEINKIHSKEIAKIWLPILLWKKDIINSPPSSSFYIPKFLSLKFNSNNSSISPSPCPNPSRARMSTQESEVLLEALVAMIKQHELIFSL